MLKFFKTFSRVIKPDKMEKPIKSWIYLFIEQRMLVSSAEIHLIEVDSTGKDIKVTIYTGRPGVLIGVSGCFIDSLKDYLERLAAPQKVEIHLKEYSPFN